MRLLPRHLWLLTLTLTSLFAGWFGAMRIDQDFGWRLRHGQLILERGFSTTEPFSYTMPSYPFVSHAWTFDVATAWIYDHIGYAALTILITILAALAIALVTYPLRSNWYGSVLVAATWAGLLASFGTRAQVVAWLPFAFGLWFVTLPKARWIKLRWLTPLIAIVWANLHGSFIAFLVLLSLRWLIEIISNRRLDLADTLLLLTAAPLTLLNPYGHALWVEVSGTLTDRGLNAVVREWLPIWQAFNGTYFLIVFLILAGLVVTLHKKQSLPVLILTGLALAGTISVRHLTLAILAASFFLARNRIDLRKMQADPGLRPVKYLLTLALSFAIVWPFYAFAKEPPFEYPTASTNWIIANRPSAKIFNHYDTGGYLIWKAPQAKVFIDGRMPSWRLLEPPPGNVRSSFHSWRWVVDGDQAYFEKISKEFGIDTILWPLSDTKTIQLFQAAGWKEVFRDTHYLVLIP